MYPHCKPPIITITITHALTHKKTATRVVDNNSQGTSQGQGWVSWAALQADAEEGEMSNRRVRTVTCDSNSIMDRKDHDTAHINSTKVEGNDCVDVGREESEVIASTEYIVDDSDDYDNDDIGAVCRGMHRGGSTGLSSYQADRAEDEGVQGAISDDTLIILQGQHAECTNRSLYTDLGLLKPNRQSDYYSQQALTGHRMIERARSRDPSCLEIFDPHQKFEDFYTLRHDQFIPPEALAVVNNVILPSRTWPYEFHQNGRIQSNDIYDTCAELFQGIGRIQSTSSGLDCRSR